jgi:hypothetical protein
MNIPCLLIPMAGLALAAPRHAPAQAEAASVAPLESEAKPAKGEPAEQFKAPAGQGIPQDAAGDARSINAYLTARLKQLQDSHRGQEAFGKKSAAAWADFWRQIYNDRKDFDIKMARQRLNHFQILDSLDPADRRQATADFEKTQAGLKRSFEVYQRRKLQEFFDQLATDVRNFSAEQGKWFEQFMVSAEK